ncbi:MAG: alpha/beta hydrolase [Paracoccaceae bacterium]|nr:alpha/beta hydrolase [Paracoccaceae bacterium]
MALWEQRCNITQYFLKMEIKVLPESNFPILEGGSLYITSSIDDRKIRFAIWPKGTKGLIIFFNGRNEYIEKYNEAYKKFQNLGYAVVTLDWRGQGLSDRAKNLDHLGYVDNFSEYQLDVEAVLNHVEVIKVSGPRILVGHSTGGCIGLRTLTNKKFNIERAIFLAPLWGAYPMQRLSYRISQVMVRCGWAKKSPISRKLKPYVLSTTPERNCHTSDQIQFQRLQKIIVSDPRLSTGPATFGWIAAVGDELINLEKQKSLTIPHLVLLGQNDSLISQKEVKKKCRFNKHCELQVISGARHELLIEEQSKITYVWKKIESFLQ